MFDNKDIYKYISNKRKKVPKRYNQLELLTELTNQDIDHYISISNRSDGKSFNYIHFFVDLSIDFSLGFILLCRHYTLRNSYMSFLIKLYDKSKDLNSEDLHFKRTDTYIMVLNKEKLIGVITDLNEASDLKYESNFLKDFPIVIYDEFLALEEDYIFDEWNKLKTIYETINRVPNIPYIKIPKIFYLGNAVNFSSPVLSELNLFNKLENHPINTMKQYNNVLLEMRKNDNANEERNIRAFSSENDSMTTGQFKINTYNIARNEILNKFDREGYESFFIKLENEYLRVKYTKSYDILLSIVTNTDDDYYFNYLLKDNNVNTTYLDYKFYRDNFYKKYDRGDIIFENSYSKDFITTKYDSLNIIRCIKYYETYYKEKDNKIKDKKEIIYEDQLIRNTKRRLVQKFFEGL